MIYSPAVPVFRDDQLRFCKHYPISCLTSPAVNAKNYIKRNPGRGNARKMLNLMYERSRRVLDVAVQHNHSCLILGAWGCGVFGNDYGDIGVMFSKLLKKEYANCFDLVVFAHLSWNEKAWHDFEKGLPSCLDIHYME